MNGDLPGREVVSTAGDDGVPDGGDSLRKACKSEDMAV